MWRPTCEIWLHGKMLQILHESNIKLKTHSGPFSITQDKCALSPSSYSYVTLLTLIFLPLHAVSPCLIWSYALVKNNHYRYKSCQSIISCFIPSLPWSWGTRCGLPSDRPAFALTHWAAWTSFPPTATSTWCRSPTPRARPLLAGPSASASAARTPCLAWTLTKVEAL